MTPAETLKALRLRAKLTQNQLADKAGIDRSWYNQMERGKRPLGPSPRAKLAKALGVSPVELGGEAEAEPEYKSLLDRHGELEAEVLRLAGAVDNLAGQVDRLEERVELLERRLPPGSQGEARSSTT